VAGQKVHELINEGGDQNAVLIRDRGFVSGMSQAMRTLESVIAEIAPTNIPVLLAGECGTGKAMYARRVHDLSERSSEPFVKVACASMNTTTFSSELALNSGDNGEPRRICRAPSSSMRSMNSMPPASGIFSMRCRTATRDRDGDCS
jgi:transcriptional regulator of acetoin/glycerol metabolism